jgi:pimeloyl-ACP methyl ester carboxylesterase
VIGHSLGSVIAYEYLCRYRPPGVKLLVTLGSPLGIPNLVFHRLEPRPVNERGAWPGAASMAWVNVAEPRDIVALRKDLSPLFPSPDPLRGVADRLVHNDEDIHGAGPYLSAKETGNAIAAAL